MRQGQERERVSRARAWSSPSRVGTAAAAHPMARFRRRWAVPPWLAGPKSRQGLARAELFALLCALGFANGILGRVQGAIRYDGLAAALLATFNISAVAWVAFLACPARCVRPARTRTFGRTAQRRGSSRVVAPSALRQARDGGLRRRPRQPDSLGGRGTGFA